MVNFYSCFLREDCNATIQDLAGMLWKWIWVRIDILVDHCVFLSPFFTQDHINHIRIVAGVDSVGIGSDYNGVSQFPPGMEDESSYPKLFAELLRQGNWSEEELGKLANGNLIRVWKHVEVIRDILSDQEPFEELMDNWTNPECHTKNSE